MGSVRLEANTLWGRVILSQLENAFRRQLHTPRSLRAFLARGTTSLAPLPLEPQRAPRTPR